MTKARIYQGVAYFPSYEACASFAASNGTPLGEDPARDYRAVEYQRGWAIQHGYSGGYIGPNELRPARFGEGRLASLGA